MNTNTLKKIIAGGVIAASTLGGIKGCEMLAIRTEIINRQNYSENSEEFKNYKKNYGPGTTWEYIGRGFGGAIAGGLAAAIIIPVLFYKRRELSEREKIRT